MPYFGEDEIPVPIIDSQLCTGCGLCVRVCPNGALAMQGSIAVVSAPDACTYAGHCEQICPAQAISRPFRIVLVPMKKADSEK